jgi:hypothetical protein
MVRIQLWLRRLPVSIGDSFRYANELVETLAQKPNRIIFSG